MIKDASTGWQNAGELMNHLLFHKGLGKFKCKSFFWIPERVLELLSALLGKRKQAIETENERRLRTPQQLAATVSYNSAVYMSTLSIATTKTKQDSEDTCQETIPFFISL